MTDLDVRLRHEGTIDVLNAEPVTGDATGIPTSHVSGTGLTIAGANGAVEDFTRKHMKFSFGNIVHRRRIRQSSERMIQASEAFLSQTPLSTTEQTAFSDRDTLIWHEPPARRRFPYIRRRR